MVIKSKLALLAQVSILLLATGCFLFDPTEKPTSFSGKVIDSATRSPISDGYLVFVGERYYSIYLRPVTRDTVPLTNEGKFDWKVVPNEEGLHSIGVFLVAKRDASVGSSIYLQEYMDCSPYDCFNFPAGKKYKFDIKVTWPPDE